MLEPEITTPRGLAEPLLIRLGREAVQAAERKGVVFGAVNPDNVRRAASDAASNAYDVFVRAVLAHDRTDAAIADELIRRHGGGAA